MSATQHPLEVEAVIFDLDGVLTRTADLHASAWKESFDPFLLEWSESHSAPFRPFDVVGDYLAYVDGLPRAEGVRRFLESRGIPSDADDVAVVRISEQKTRRFRERLKRDGVEVFPDTVALVEELRALGVRIGLVTSSRHGREILETTGTGPLFDAVIDGSDIQAGGLRGKPAPDAFTRCAELLDVAPVHAAVFEDAVAGVAAARNGNFGLIVGVDRGDNRKALHEAGADTIVAGVGELDAQTLDQAFRDCRERAAWRVEQEGLDPLREPAMESLFAVGNGYMGVRGAPDILLRGSQGDLMVAGIYDRKRAERPYSEKEFLNIGGDSLHAELVSAPFPFRLSMTADAKEIDAANPLSFRRTLELRTATLHADARFGLGDRNVLALRSMRCASADDHHLLLQEVELRPEYEVAELHVDASLDDPDLTKDHPHLVALPVAAVPGIQLQRYATQDSGYEICIASRTTLVGSGEDRCDWVLPAGAREPLLFRRYVVVYTSRDGIDDPGAAALAHLARLQWDGFDAALERHQERWERLWKNADVRIEGGYAAEQALRFNSYHLHSTAARDPHVSIGARALSGRAYEGHIFWDVEIFMLPFYIHTDPPAARNALQYRHHTLDGARARALAGGHRGASFAWESTVTGEDVTPRVIRLKSSGREIPIFTGAQQIHVTADVAYGVCRYWEGTGDDAFMREAGVEILCETARYWATRCVDGPLQRHIRGVVGPDEYHHSVDDNAYTNWMVRYNLEHAKRAAEWLAHECPDAWHALVERIALHPGEPADWMHVAETLYCPTPGANGVIEQFSGFFDLENYPLPAEERLQAPVHRLFDWDRINRLKLIKQADVLMLPFLFPERFSDEVLAANYNYYEPLTDHGSSLSPAVHAALAARLGLSTAARRYWRQSLWLDLSNVMTNSALGVHPACMGGTWQALVYGFLGVTVGDGGPMVSADAVNRLPAGWRSVRTNVRWRGRDYPLEVER